MFNPFALFEKKENTDAQQAHNEAQYLERADIADKTEAQPVEQAQAKAEPPKAAGTAVKADAPKTKAKPVLAEKTHKSGPREERRVHSRFGKLKLSVAVAGVLAAVLLPVMLIPQGAAQPVEAISDTNEKMSIGTIREEAEPVQTLGPQQAPLVFPGELEESTKSAEPTVITGEITPVEPQQALVPQSAGTSADTTTDTATDGAIDENGETQADEGGDGDEAARAAADQYTDEEDAQDGGDNQAQWVDTPVGESEEPVLEETNESLLQEGDASGLLNTDDSVAGAATFSAMPEDMGPLMMQLKERLMELGYMQKDVITEDYDPYTQLGVMFFQRDNGLTVTGIADTQTLELALYGNVEPYCIILGTEGEDVRQLQSALTSLGFTANASGVYDESTAAVVREYQTARGAQATGVVDSLLRKVIMDESALHGVFANSTAVVSQGVEALIAVAEQQLGKTYVLGGKGPDVFDCSGLVYYCLNQSGYPIGYMTSGGWANSSYETISGMENLQRGDIVCFTGHVGIYLGDGLMLDASSSEGKIRITNDIRQTAYWINSFICGKRVLN